MGHDIGAELAGYAAELKGYEQRGLHERAAAVREQMATLAGPARAQVDKLRREADGYAALGQDDRAAQVRRQADELEGQLPAQDKADGDDDQEDGVDGAAGDESPASRRRAAAHSGDRGTDRSTDRSTDRGADAPQETATPGAPQNKAAPPAKKGK